MGSPAGRAAAGGPQLGWAEPVPPSLLLINSQGPSRDPPIDIWVRAENVKRSMRVKRRSPN